MARETPLRPQSQGSAEALRGSNPATGRFGGRGGAVLRSRFSTKFESSVPGDGREQLDPRRVILQQSTRCLGGAASSRARCSSGKNSLSFMNRTSSRKGPDGSENPNAGPSTGNAAEYTAYERTFWTSTQMTRGEPRVLSASRSFF